MEWNPLVPELIVENYEISRSFYQNVFGFGLLFERSENRFGYFDLNGAQVMLLEDANIPVYQMNRPGPKGKGLHFQIELPSISAILQRLEESPYPLESEVVESWYQVDNIEHGQREFFVHDCDGYLYRFYQHIGERPC
jgi:catechol 2,3-dioxygenase-like lactoylglutathione lyase family enzyme